MKHPVFILPDAMKALHALNKATEIDEVPYKTHKLVHLRASQINGCGPCVAMHSEELKQAGDAERAALALTEAITRPNDRADPVPDDIWEEATRHYDEKAMAALIVSIGQINIWNRLNAAVRQVAGSWK